MALTPQEETDLRAIIISYSNGKTIPALTDAGTLSGTELVEVSKTGVSKYTNLKAIADLEKGEIVNDLTTGGAAKFGSAENDKLLEANKAPKNNPIFTGNVVVPAADAATEAVQLQQMQTAAALIVSDEKAVFPSIAHYKRVLADSGTVLDKGLLINAFTTYNKQLPETKLLLCPELGIKERTSGLNKFGIKMYGMDSANTDAVQLTDATQPYMTVNAAPNSRKGLKYVQSQTQTGLVDFPDVSFAAGDSWTLTAVIKHNIKKSWSSVTLSATSSIEISSTSLNFVGNGVTLLSVPNSNLPFTKTNVLEFQYANGTGLIKINNKILSTTVNSGAVTFNYVANNTAFPMDGTLYFLHLTNTRISESQSQLNHAFLSAIFPEIEGIAIGNQFWATENYEGTVDGAGNVINNVTGNTTDGSAELVTATADRDFSSDTGWWSKLDASISITSGVLRYLNTPTNKDCSKNSLLTVDKWYRITYTVVSISSGAVRAVAGFSFGTQRTTAGTYTEYIKCTSNGNLYINSVGITTADIDDISIKEVGWDSSTLIYDAAYAAASGTVLDKTYAGCKAAAMWCYYNNDPAMGAIYGKLYNWYAVYLIWLNPPRGWRVPSKTDFDQLVAFLGGSTVAGGKLKAKFGGFDNGFSSNESGMSLIAGGFRYIDGVFNVVGNYSREWCSDSGYRVEVVNTDILSKVNGGYDLRQGFSLRLLRNTPATPDASEKTTGYVTNNIGVTPLDITNLPFGNSVKFLRIVSETAISNFQAVLYTGAGSAKETLCTGISIAANEPKYIPISVAQSLQLTDFTVRVSGTKTDTAARVMYNVGLESAYKNML